MFSKQRSLRSIMVLRNSRKQLSPNNWKMEKFKYFPLIKMLKISHNLIIILILLVLCIISKINNFLRIDIFIFGVKICLYKFHLISFEKLSFLYVFVYQWRSKVCWSLCIIDSLMKKNSQMKAFEFYSLLILVNKKDKNLLI